MSPKAVMELTKIVAKRYLKTRKKKGKTKILDEYCENTGLNRKYAITKIRDRCFREKEPKKRGRKRLYSNEADAVLIEIWKHFDGICAERLHPYLPEAISVLERCGYLKINSATKAEVLKMSRASIGRRISKHRELNERVLVSTTKPGYLLKKNIPIQTSCWDNSKPGFCEIDLVAHCGGNASGDFINTLQAVDIKTTWTERVAVMGKAQERVFNAIKKIRSQLPLELLGLDSDNGGEFINHQLWKYCEDEKIQFTRSRPYMKKDNAHIEQKNWPLVRKILGYNRFDTHHQLILINDLYDNELRLFLNFFQPTLKLVSKIRSGAKIKRKYDRAKTPYQRVLECSEISQKKKNELIALYKTLDPVQLRHRITKKIKVIISLVQSGF